VSVGWLQARLCRDPVLRFLRILERYIGRGMEVLDVGAGAGRQNPYGLRGRVKRLVGVDLDPRVADNPLLDDGVVADVTRLPFGDGSFDLAFSIYVLEHLADPGAFAREIGRVLRPGGYFLFLTPNRYHYVPLIAAATPTGFHRWVNRRRGRAGADTFPTRYRLNTRRAVGRHFGAAGFEVTELTSIEVQPNYRTFCTPAFLAGVAYERLVNASDWLSGLRVNLIGVCRKGGEGGRRSGAGGDT
jgi:SAM-dependent methyltransferase